jgi:hypothetical protein
MSLIHDIQAAAISPTSDVPSLLRMCKLLAARISHHQLGEWVDHELNGYPDVGSMPGYRIVEVESYGSFVGSFRNANRMQVPVSILPEMLQERYRHAYLGSSISAYTSLLEGDKTGRLEEAWPLNIALHHASKIMHDMQCVSAWKEIPIGAIVRLMDSVKNRILGFAIDLEREAPNAGDMPIGSQPPLSSEKMTQIFHTNISGNVGNISNSGENFSQAASVCFEENNWNDLTKRLYELGLQPPDLEGMQQALDQARLSPTEKEKKAVAGNWIGRLTAKVISGSAGVAVEVGAAGVAKAIATYLGLST